MKVWRGGSTSDQTYYVDILFTCIWRSEVKIFTYSVAYAKILVVLLNCKFSIQVYYYSMTGIYG